MVSAYCIVLFRHKWYIVVQALQLWVLMTWAQLQVLLPPLETHSNGLHASGAYKARLQSSGHRFTGFGRRWIQCPS